MGRRRTHAEVVARARDDERRAVIAYLAARARAARAMARMGKVSDEAADLLSRQIDEIAQGIGQGLHEETES